jgi:hypothetical protein
MAAKGITMTYNEVHKVIGEGNFVLTMSDSDHEPEPFTTCFAQDGLDCRTLGRDRLRMPAADAAIQRRWQISTVALALGRPPYQRRIMAEHLKRHWAAHLR